MKVNLQSPVNESDAFLHHWDTMARKHFSYFELRKNGERAGLQALLTSFATCWKGPIAFHKRFSNIDNLALRQLLGSISSAERKDVNANVGSEKGIWFIKGNLFGS